MKSEIVAQATKSSPPVVATLVAVTDTWTLSDAVAIATILYVGLQAGYLVWKWYIEWRKTNGSK